MRINGTAKRIKEKSMAIDSDQFEAEQSSYGVLANGNDILAERPEVRTGIESIAAGINPDGTLPNIP